MYIFYLIAGLIKEHGGERRMQGVRPMRTVFRVFVSSSRRCHLDVVALLTL
jgi:hypothetical protein